jgi:hypothetical protein
MFSSLLGESLGRSCNDDLRYQLGKASAYVSSMTTPLIFILQSSSAIYDGEHGN